MELVSTPPPLTSPPLAPTAQILGDSTYSPPQCDVSGFTLNLTGVQCYGLSATSAGQASTAACQQACCTDPTCTIWQFDAGTADGACWTGADCSDNTTDAAWVSFARPTPGPTPAPVAVCADAGQPCSVPFPDAGWRNVNTPHDFIVEGKPDPNADRGHGYLPFNVSWFVSCGGCLGQCATVGVPLSVLRSRALAPRQFCWRARCRPRKHGRVLQGAPQAHAHGPVPLVPRPPAPSASAPPPPSPPLGRRYRKHFTVDASLEGKLLSLLFDGVYKNSDVWLNGIFVGHHTSGYTSFRWWLHNVTAPGAPGKPVLVYGGGDNVLAIRVDALSSQEGWFYELSNDSFDAGRALGCFWNGQPSCR
jgi:hypothetical protein